MSHCQEIKNFLQKKLYKNFGGKDKRCTFAPAKEEGKAS